jgi:hypothetical protein
MSKARDKANIPSLNFSSTGIDDNATSTAITINSSEQVAFTDGTVSLPSITNLGDENTGIFFPSADTIAFSEGGTEAMRITSDGRLGIGTTTPTEKLSVDGSVIFNESGNNVDFRVEGDTDANLLFVDASTDRVGIGNSSPSFKLDVKDGDVAIRETDSSVGSGIRLINDVGTQIIFRGAGSTRTNPGATQGMPQLVSSAGYDLFIGADGNNNIPFTTNRSERMRLTSDGKLGIGTSSPTEVLHVVGDILATGGDFKSDANNYLGFSNNTFARFVINDSEKMRIDSSGNVGIGTTSPSLASGNGIVISGGSSVARLELRNTTSGTTSSDGGFLTYFANDLFLGNRESGNSIFYTNNTERMRIDSSGNVGIGLTDPTAQLHVNTNSTGRSNVYFSNFNTSGGISSQEVAIGFQFNRTGGGINLSAARVVAGKEREWVGAASNQDGFLAFETCLNESVSEKMRIDSYGNVFVGKTVTTAAVTGCIISPEGYGFFTRPASTVLFANRQSDDGTVIGIFQAGTEEGTISVSGTTVSYNGFTGTHWSRFQDNSTPTILRGTVLETLDEMCDWYNLEFDVITQDENGNDVTTPEKIPHVLTDTESNGDVITYNHEGTDVQATIVKEGDVKHMMSKVSDNSDAKNVYGVFVAYDLDGEGYNDFYVASVGSFVVRIKANETIAKGDLLQSNGDGTAKVQTDDNIKSSSFAKVLSTTIIETYEDGSYLVPCSLMC